MFHKSFNIQNHEESDSKDFNQEITSKMMAEFQISSKVILMKDNKILVSEYTGQLTLIKKPKLKRRQDGRKTNVA